MAESQYSLQDLFDLNELKHLFNNFSAATGFTTGLVENTTGKVLANSGWREICTKFHRATPGSSRHCLASNNELTHNLTGPGKIRINHCQNGLVDGATPIIINGIHYANLFSGQILFEAPDLERFKKQAAEFGYDEDAYLNALAKVPIVKEADFKSALEFLAGLATSITTQGLNRLELLKHQEQLEKEIAERKRIEAELQQVQAGLASRIEQGDAALQANGEELSRRETKLNETEHRLQTLVQAIPDLIFFKDSMGRHLLANNAFYDTLGLSPGKIIGKTVEEILPPEKARVCRLADDKVLREKKTVRLEEQIKDRHGNLLTTDTIKIPLYGQDGNPTGLVAICRDITERKQAEENLKKSSKYLDLILNGMSDALMIINRDYTIADVNSRFIERHKGSRADIVGRHCYEISHQESRPCDKNHPCPLKQVLETKAPVMVEHRHLDRNGNEQIVELYSFPLFNDQAEVVQVVEVIQDITARKRTEKEHKKLHAQLRHAQKMEAIGSLAGGIAHDFNNILVPIFGNTELAKSYIPADNPAQERLDEIIKSSNRAKDLVKQILAFARKSEQKLGPVQIHLIVKEALGLIRASIPATIDIQQDIDQECGFVLADPTQLHQVVMNLCTNAFQSIENEEGLLEIILKKEEVTADSETGGQIIKPGSYAMLSVRDNGGGIDPTITELIFDPYFSTKEPEKGSGLGLAVVQGIMKSHQGFIMVKSSLGKGSTFKAFFPLVDTETETADNPPELLPGGTESILFVDDELAVVDVWKLILASLGYKVTARASSVEALEIFQAQPEKFDLVITDHAMPKMPGSEFAKKILMIRPDIPIILCTGYSSVMSAEMAQSIGIKAFLMKPIETHILAQKIRKVLDGK